MKLVIGIVRPEKANDVLEALYRAEVRGVSISRVQGHGGELDRVETYRGTTVKMGLSDKVRFEIAVSDQFVEPTIDALCEGARTGEVGDGKIFVVPLERVVRIRTRRDRRQRRHPGGVRDCTPAAIDTGDTAWMLVATALVLLMTPALGLFYAGLVRSKNTLNTFMMCIAALGVATVTWALVGYSLAFDEGNGFIGGLDHAFLRDVGFDAARGDDDPAPAVHGLPGDLLHPHRRARLGRGRRADALRRRTSSSPRSGRCSSTPCSRTGSSAAAGCSEGGTLDFAGGVPVEMASGFSAFAAALVVGARKDYGRQALLPAQRDLRPARRRPAVVRLVRLQRRQRLLGRRRRRARVHQHAARARPARSWSGSCSTSCAAGR